MRINKAESKYISKFLSWPSSIK